MMKQFNSCLIHDQPSEIYYLIGFASAAAALLILSIIINFDWNLSFYHIPTFNFFVFTYLYCNNNTM